MSPWWPFQRWTQGQTVSPLMSVPVLTEMMSVPAPPSMVSAAVRLPAIVKVSLPAPPTRVSASVASLDPTIVSLPAPPVTVKACAAVLLPDCEGLASVEFGCIDRERRRVGIEVDRQICSRSCTVLNHNRINFIDIARSSHEASAAIRCNLKGFCRGSRTSDSGSGVKVVNALPFTVSSTAAVLVNVSALVSSPVISTVVAPV